MPSNISTWSNRLSNPIHQIGVLQVDGTLSVNNGADGRNYFLLEQPSSNTRIATINPTEILKGQAAPIHILGAAWNPTASFDRLAQYSEIKLSISPDGTVQLTCTTSNADGSFSDIDLTLTITYSDKSGNS